MPGFDPSTRSSPSPSWRSGCSSAGASSDVFERSLAQPRGRRGLELLRGPADRQRPPRLPPRPRPRLQGRLPALPDDVRLPGAAQGGLGLPRPAGRARGRKAARHLLQAGDRGVRDRRVQPALPRVGLRVRRGVEPADRADRLLDRPRRPLRHPRGRLHRVGLVVAEAALGRRTASTRATRSSPTARAAAPRSPRTRSRWATRTSRTPPYTCASRCSARTARGGESLLVWTTTPWTLPGNVAVAVAPEVTYVRARVGGETLILAEPLVERVLGEGAEIARPLPGLRPGRPPLPRARSSSSPTGEPGDAFPVLAGDFVTTEDGTGLVHIAPAFGEDDYAVAAANGIFDPTDARHALQPGQPRRPLRRPGQRLRGPLRQGPRGHRGADRRPRAPRPALPRAGLRARLPALLALRHAAALLREVELVHRHLAGPRRSCSPTTRRSAGTPSTSSTAASANGWRTTSTGRSRATATGARRCRSGDCAERGLRRAASAPARSPSCASAPAARSPTTSTAPTSTRSTLDCEQVRRRDAPGRVGDRHLVRQRRDALRPVPLPVRERGGVRGALPRRLHLRGP